MIRTCYQKLPIPAQWNYSKLGRYCSFAYSALGARGIKNFGAGNALEWGRVRLPVDDDHFGFCCDDEQITLEIERADGSATGAECVCRA